MICTKCFKVNQCDCESCSKRRIQNNITSTNVLKLIDEENGIFECSYCLSNFSMDESANLEWDNWNKSIMIRITKDMSYLWFESDDKFSFYNGDVSDLEYNRSFFLHFGLYYDDIKYSDRVNLKRNYKINKLLDEN